MSLALDVTINSVGLTPNPVNVNAVYLAQVEAVQVTHTWGEYSQNTWGSQSSKLYG